MQDLATELSERIDMDSLSMYDMLKEVWSNANKCSYGAKATKPSVKVQTLMNVVLYDYMFSWS